MESGKVRKRKRKWMGALAGVAFALSISVAAQIGGKPITGGNPTPGTPQPEPPDLADRIALTGCVQAATRADGAPPAANTADPSSARFVLVSAERLLRIPQDTGGSSRASNAASRTYKLKGIDSQLSPFVGAKVEISGEVVTSSSEKPATDPELQVEFVQRIAGKCLN